MPWLPTRFSMAQVDFIGKALQEGQGVDDRQPGGNSAWKPTNPIGEHSEFLSRIFSCRREMMPRVSLFSHAHVSPANRPLHPPIPSPLTLLFRPAWLLMQDGSRMSAVIEMALFLLFDSSRSLAEQGVWPADGAGMLQVPMKFWSSSA